MTNLNKLIERRQGDNKNIIDYKGDYYIKCVAHEEVVRRTYRKALEDVLAGLPKERTVDFEMKTRNPNPAYAKGHNTALQTVRAQIEELLGKIDEV
jgi:protoporphyrinogen oxidase